EPDTSLAPEDPQAQRPPESAFNRFPVTVLPQHLESPIATPADNLPYGTLGPDPVLPLPFEPATEQEDLYGLQASLARDDGFRLGPPAPLEPQQRMDLFSALRYATRHSRQYQSRVED